MKLPKPSGIIEQIVGRRHVGERFVDVVRYVVSRLEAEAWRTMDRDKRRKLVGMVVRAHAENRDLYRQVMGGF